jgi:hypothetical protein
MIPILTHICFQGERFYAYDDKAATVVELATGINCGVRGDKLISMLKPISGKIKLKQEGAHVAIVGRDSASGSMYKASLAALSEDAYVYEDPSHRGVAHSWIGLTDELIAALLLAYESVSQNAMDIDWSGVNILFDGDDTVKVCACDNMNCVTISVTTTLGHVLGGATKRIIVPRATVAQIKRVYSTMKDKDVPDQRRLMVSDKHVAARFKSSSAELPDVKVVSKLIKSDIAFDFEGTVEKYLAQAGEWCPMPNKGGGISVSVSRALAACDGDDEATLKVQATGKKLMMTVEASGSQMEDQHKLQGDPGDGLVSVDPKHVARFVDVADDFTIANGKALCFRRGDGDFFMVGSKAGKRSKRPAEDTLRATEDIPRASSRARRVA